MHSTSILQHVISFFSIDSSDGNHATTEADREAGGCSCSRGFLCVRPAWARTRRGSSPLCDETMKQRTTRSQGREGDRPSGGRLWDSHEPMNKNGMRGRRDVVSWHNTAKPFVSVPEVNAVVVWRRSASLPAKAAFWRSHSRGGDLSGMAPRSRAGSVRPSNGPGDRAEPERSGDSQPPGCPEGGRSPATQPRS